MGYAVVTRISGDFELVGHGVVRTDPSSALPARLLGLWTEVRELLGKYAPDAVALERTYFQLNARSAMQVAQAAGVILLAAEDARIPSFGYTPNEVKQAVCGYGAAEKEQVTKMTAKLLSVREGTLRRDAADAAAVAVAHLNGVRLRRVVEASG